MGHVEFEFNANIVVYIFFYFLKEIHKNSVTLLIIVKIFFFTHFNNLNV